MTRLYVKIYLGFLAVVMVAVPTAAVLAHLSHRHLPRQAMAVHQTSRFLVPLIFVAIVLAIGSYPIARRITRRLESVRNGVASWGAGDLSARAPVEGLDEVAQLAKRFNQAAERVERLVDQQRRMLQSASHELRSPLARLRMTVELLSESGGDRPERARLASDACGDIAELDALVGELLAAARAEHGRTVAADPIDLVAIVAEVCREASVPVSAARELGPVPADRALVRRAVRNLVDNARRHGGGDVRVSLEGVVGGLRVAVEDAGPTIPRLAADRLFEPFYRPQGHDEGRDGGVGLGLALVRQIAEAHGGRAGYSAADAGGSSFWIELPVELDRAEL